MSEQPQFVVENKKSGPMANIMAVLYLAGLLIVCGGGFWYGCEANADVEAAADAYIEALRKKDYDAAYAMLAPQAQAMTPRDKFERSMSTPELRSSVDHGWNRTSSSSNGRGCVAGGVEIDGDDYSVTMWMWKQGENWTVHTVYFEQWDHTNVPWRCFSSP